MSESNAILAKRVLENDEGAFAVLFGRYHSRVFGVCMKILHHRQDAEDMTQETFSRAVRYLSRWDSKRPFEPWLIAIAGNRCRTLLASRQGHRSLTAAVEPAIDSDPSGSLATLTEEVDLALTGSRAANGKPSNSFINKGWATKKLPLRMNRPLGTIKTWIHRARVQLIRQLQDREVLHLDSGSQVRHADVIQETSAVRGCVLTGLEAMDIGMTEEVRP